eukprot:UN01333
MGSKIGCFTFLCFTLWLYLFDDYRRPIVGSMLPHYTCCIRYKTFISGWFVIYLVLGGSGGLVVIMLCGLLWSK